ncbi:hypothetical protein [uncultured Sphingomonas sp.]|uniref:hypothetical protein n=1 Tax=uncultured Sphingomonas sp. TaxID=158754 RepID=UPI0035C9D48B
MTTGGGRAAGVIRKIMDIVAGEEDGVPLIAAVTVTRDGATYQRLDEGKWISGRFDRNIRIDQPSHMAGGGKVHAHILGRKGDEVVVVNIDGTGSHGSKGILHPRDADALRGRGFDIPDDRIVEWMVLPDAGLELLLG